MSTVLIPRNTTIPTRKSELFSTAADGQTGVDVHVLQGERPMARDNRTLGRFQLSGLPPAPRGVPQIEVTFDIDANGIVHVTAKDKATGKEQAVTITASSGLDKAEVDRLVQDAEANAREDQARRDLATARNDADALIYSVEKTVTEQGAQLDAGEIATVEGAIGDVRTALNGEDARGAEDDDRASAACGAGRQREAGARRQPGLGVTASPRMRTSSTPKWWRTEQVGSKVGSG